MINSVLSFCDYTFTHIVQYYTRNFLHFVLSLNIRLSGAIFLVMLILFDCYTLLHGINVSTLPN